MNTTHTQTHKQILQGVSKYHVDLFKEMDSLLESGVSICKVADSNTTTIDPSSSPLPFLQNNYKRYRDRLSTIPTPAVPYIGVFLKDLTFICDGNPDYLRGGLINIHKRRQVCVYVYTMYVCICVYTCVHVLQFIFSLKKVWT